MTHFTLQLVANSAQAQGVVAEYTWECTLHVYARRTPNKLRCQQKRCGAGRYRASGSAHWPTHIAEAKHLLPLSHSLAHADTERSLNTAQLAGRYAGICWDIHT